jgi:hypothetical protein
LAELQESVGRKLVGRILFAAEDRHLQQMEKRVSHLVRDHFEEGSDDGVLRA